MTAVTSELMGEGSLTRYSATGRGRRILLPGAVLTSSNNTRIAELLVARPR